MAVIPTIRKTRVDLLRRVRAALQTKAGNNDGWDVDDLYEEINEAQHWVQMKMARIGEQWFMAREFYTLGGADYSIRFPDDCLREDLWEKKDSDDDAGDAGWTKMSIVPPQHLDQYNSSWPRTSNEPSVEVWYLEAQGLRTRLKTPPTGTYRLRYFRRVKDLQDDTQVCEVPADYHTLVIARTAQKAAQGVVDLKRYGLLSSEVRERLEELYEIASNRSMSQELSIEDAMDFGEL